jgi:DNA-binding PadR family transcriptional regulator
MQELSERTGGVWKPSPGSVYPALSLLEDEGLIKAEEADGKRVFHLTDAGRAEAESREGAPPWEQVTDGDDDGRANVGRELGLVMAAGKMFRHVGTTAQQEAAAKILAETRRQLYKILADDDPPDA